MFTAGVSLKPHFAANINSNNTQTPSAKEDKDVQQPSSGLMPKGLTASSFGITFKGEAILPGEPPIMSLFRQLTDQGDLISMLNRLDNKTLIELAAIDPKDAVSKLIKTVTVEELGTLLNEENISEIDSLIKSSNPDYQLTALNIIEEIFKKNGTVAEDVKFMWPLIHSPFPKIQKEAFNTLGEITDFQSTGLGWLLKPLLNMSTMKPERYFKVCRALNVLGKCGQRGHIPDVTKFLRPDSPVKDEQVKINALFALKNLLGSVSEKDRKPYINQFIKPYLDKKYGPNLNIAAMAIMGDVAVKEDVFALTPLRTIKYDNPEWNGYEDLVKRIHSDVVKDIRTIPIDYVEGEGEFGLKHTD